MRRWGGHQGHSPHNSPSKGLGGREGTSRHHSRRLSLLRGVLLCLSLLLAASLYAGRLLPEAVLSTSRYTSLGLAALHVGRRRTAHWAHSPSFRPGQPLLDTDGKLIQAHGGSILYHNGTFFWYGEDKDGWTYISDLWHEDDEAQHTREAQERLVDDVAQLRQRQQRRRLLEEVYNPPRVDVIGVSCYSSQDLQHWKNEGIVLPAGQHPDLAPHRVLERPKVVHNPRTNKFVMYMHIDDRHYVEAKAGVAVADSPIGPFQYIRSFRPQGQMSRDLTLFQDDDEERTAWIVYASEENKVLHLSRLTSDYLDVEGDYYRATVGKSREAPALFKHQGKYLMFTSGCTGWAPNAAEVFVAEQMEGPWLSAGNPCKLHTVSNTTLCKTTFDSQGTWVLPVPGQEEFGHFILIADRWDPKDLGASPHIWLPLWATDLRAYHRGMVWKGWHADGFAASWPPMDVVVRWEDEWDLGVFSKDPYV